MTCTSRLTSRRAAPLACTLLLALVACSSKSSTAANTALKSVEVTGASFVAVGTTQTLTAVGHRADGSTAPLTAGVTWTSSDPAVARVDASGHLVGVARGSVTVTATHDTGLAATSTVKADVVASLTGGPGPVTSHVDTAAAYYRVTGLTPGTFYAVSLTNLADDVDLAVYGDAGLPAGGELCTSDQVGTLPESCVAPANAAGELYVVADGEWTDSGSGFSLATTVATPGAPTATLAFPAAFPASGTVDRGDLVYKVTGLSAGASYVMTLSGLADDADLEVYGDGFLFDELCGSYRSGTVQDSCAAQASPSGELWVLVDGSSTAHGSSFKLNVASK